MSDGLGERFGFSETHRDLAARDQEHVLGWRFQPRIIFDRGEGVKVIDVDGNAYYDLSSGMMSMVLGHAHPELVDCLHAQADRLTHQASWYSNPWSLEYAELVASTLPGDLKVTNFAVTGSEANEIAMRMALGYTGGFDVCTMVRGLHGGSLAAEAVTSVGGARRRGLGPLTMPARSNSSCRSARLIAMVDRGFLISCARPSARRISFRARSSCSRAFSIRSSMGAG